MCLTCSVPLQHSVVQQLSLPGCAVSPPGVQHIADVLCNETITCNICKLNLSDNENVSVVILCVC